MSQTPPPTSSESMRWLEAALTRRIRGDVRFDRISRTIYATDASLYEIIPAGVVLPADDADVCAAIEVCREHGVPIVPRGAGTGIAGGAVGWGVQLDFSRHMTAVRDLDPSGRTVRVQAGVVLDELNALAAPHGLHFPVDVATSSRATLGGMIANNSCGAYSVRYGRTVDHVASLTVALSDGSVVTWEQGAYGALPEGGARGEGAEGQRGRGAKGQRSKGQGGDGRIDAKGDVVRAGSFRSSPFDPLPLCSSAPSASRAAGIEAALERVRGEYRDEVLRRYPRVMRRNGGYALDRLCMSDRANPATLVCGSEGTLALVLEATLRLSPLPRCKALAVLHFDSVLDAVAAAPLLLSHAPAAVELVDHLILSAGVPQVPAELRDAFLAGVPRAILICELHDEDAGALRERMDALLRETEAAGVGRPVRVAYEPRVQQAVWTLRQRGFGLLMSRPGDRQPHEFIEDAAVEPARLRDYIADLDALLREEGVSDVGYYAHASVGVLHVRPVLNLRQPRDVERMRRIAEGTVELVLRYGGAMTGEHGDGIVRSEWLERMYGPRIVRAFREVKEAFDPEGLFNPRKIVDPLPMDQRLRYARPRAVLPVQTHFDYGPHGGMVELAGMCIGVGQCRQKLVGTMCPSYVATLDERQTTRARALALQAALSDGGLIRGLDDPALDEVMDLCLSCKACRTECPTGVDMARLKSEWLAHRRARDGVPAQAGFIGAAPQLARIGALAPALANAALQSRFVRWLLELEFGLDRRIPPPRFAKRTLRALLKARKRNSELRIANNEWKNSAGRVLNSFFAIRNSLFPLRVIYFVDTWTNYYWPEAGVAAVRLLEAAGFEVIVPRVRCCGRPLISKGLLDEAVELAQANVVALAPYAQAGVPIVGSEPSCVSALTDEYPRLVRTEAARQVAAQTRLVESLLRPAVTLPLNTAPRTVLYHGHCHQKALFGTADALTLLNSTPGVCAQEINSGCCGMAGSFGHEKEHYDVARAVGEQRLFPAVRAGGEAVIAVSGFSCREQLAHHTGVRARHVLEIVADALPAEEG